MLFHEGGYNFEILKFALFVLPLKVGKIKKMDSM